MSKFGNRLKHLVQELIPPTTFFFVAFQLIAFTRALMLERYGIEVKTFVTATIGALVAAKVIALTDMLPFINRFPKRPIIYNIVWKTPIYFMAACVVRYLEEFIHFYRLGDDFITSNRKMIEELIWSRFWAVQIWLIVLLLIYCTLVELVRVIGPGKMKEIFLGNSGTAAIN